MDIEATLQSLVDRQAITDRIHAYCERFDRNDPDAVAALFTADATIDYNPDTDTIRGSDLAATIAVGLRDTFAATSHHVTNISIQLPRHDEASAQCYIYAWHRYHGDAPDGYLWGRYVLHFRRTQDDWLISSLLLQGSGTVDFHRARMHGIGRAT